MSRRFARIAEDLGALLEPAEVADGGRPVHPVPVVGGGGDEPSGESAEHDVGRPPQVAGGRIQRVVGPVLGPRRRGTRRCPGAATPALARGPEIPVAGESARVRAGRPRPVSRRRCGGRGRPPASGSVSVNLQSAVSNTTSPRRGSTVPEDHTLPQPLLRTRPAASTSVWNSHTGLTGVEVGGGDVSPVASGRRRRRRRAPCSPTTTGEEKMRVPSLSGSGGWPGRPV